MCLCVCECVYLCVDMIAFVSVCEMWYVCPYAWCDCECVRVYDIWVMCEMCVYEQVRLTVSVSVRCRGV